MLGLKLLPTKLSAVYILFVGMRETNRWSSLGWQPLVGGILRLGTYTVLGEPVKLSLLFYCLGQTIGKPPRREGRCVRPCLRIYEIDIMKRASHSYGQASVPARLAFRHRNTRAGVEACPYRAIFEI